MAENQSDRKLLESLGMEPLPEHTGARALPGPVNVLLYPWSASGLVHVSAATAIAMGIAVGQRWVPGLVRPSGWPFLVTVLVALYFAWYLAECVYDSARGGGRAPNILSINPGRSEARSRIAYLFAAAALYALPAVLYLLYVRRVDWVFWILTAWALVFAPIGLLAMVIQDSADALNPLFLLGSILRVSLPYLGLLILATGLAGLDALVFRVWVWPGTSLALQAVGFLIIIYGTFILAHVLGRFYWRYRERLDWGL